MKSYSNPHLSSGNAKTVVPARTEQSQYFWGVDFMSNLSDKSFNRPALAVRVDMMGNIIPPPPGPKKQ